LREGRFAEAVAAFEAALQAETQPADVYLDLGKAHLQLQHDEAASVAFEKGLELQPQAPQLHAALGKVLLKLGRPAAALEHLEQALTLTPDDLELLRLTADTAFNLGRYGAAAPHLEQLLTHSQDPLFRGRLAVCYLRLGRVDEGERLVQELLREESLPPAELKFLGGVLHYQKGNQRWAMRDFYDALRLNARHALAECFVGEIYAQWGRWHEAITAYEQSAVLDPLAPAPHLGLSVCWKAVGDAEKAAAARQRALALDPELESEKP